MNKRRLDPDGMGVATERRVFRENLIARMATMEVSSAQLARKAGLSKDAISSYTTMRSLPGKDTLLKLAIALKCKPHELMPKTGGEIGSVLELREYTKPGFKLVIVRMALPEEEAVALISQLMKRSKEGLSPVVVRDSPAPRRMTRGRPPKVTSSASSSSG